MFHFNLRTKRPSSEQLREQAEMEGAVTISPFKNEEAGSTSKNDNGVDVLLVEDNKVNQRVASLTLQKLGYRVTIANDGFEALELAETKQFPVICMDVSMPGMDGLDATRRLRNLDVPSSKARVIAMTGHAFEEDRKRCLDAGMDDFLAKPFSVADLRSALERCEIAA